jgi:hypothetical protein
MRGIKEVALPELYSGLPSTLMEALIATADRQVWARYCRLIVELEGGGPPATPIYAAGSIESQQQDQWQARGERRLTPDDEAAGRRRLAQRGAPLGFAGAVSPLGAAGGVAFDQFIARGRGSPALLAEIEAVERQLVDGFEAAGRSGRYRVAGFCDGARKEIDPDWFGRVRFDFARNAVVLADDSEVAGIEVMAVPSTARVGPGHERPARVMLRQALITLWERGAFTAGTGNERVLALALRELGLPASDPPYGFKSAETVRKLRKALKMSL